MEQNPWYAIKDPSTISSPALLVYPDRIRQNIHTMIRMCRDAAFLRPHIKTHKTAEIIQMQLDQGIRKFKCATIAEAELLGSCRAQDILLAMQPVGPNIDRFLDLLDRFPASLFSTLIDNEITLRAISERAAARHRKVSLYIDLNTGMDRTGIEPGEAAAELFKKMSNDPNLVAKGLHVYDGHIRYTDITHRSAECEASFEKVSRLKEALARQGLDVETIVAGGSPTFPFHARREGVECSPGTTLLWDEQYATSFPDMEFLPAAVLLTRIISAPRPGIVCLDLGHKSVAPEMEFPRVRIFGMENCRQTGQSEEHLVIACPENNSYPIGSVHYALPMHVCPTVAKYPYLQTVEDNRVTGSWKVAARDHTITV